MDYGTRSGKSLSLGMPMAPQDNLRTPKSQSLGMPRKASPLSSTSISNFTWSYIFIHHMICVLLGASFSFVSIFLLLLRIMFCIFIFNKNVKDSLYHAYFASIHVAVLKQKVYRCCKNSLEKSENGIMLNLFAYWALINLLQWEFSLIIFGVREVLILLHSLQTVLFWQIAVMVALYAYVCLFNDSIWG